MQAIKIKGYLTPELKQKILDEWLGQCEGVTELLSIIVPPDENQKGVTIFVTPDIKDDEELADVLMNAANDYFSKKK
jgi:hypothetical protein